MRVLTLLDEARPDWRDGGPRPVRVHLWLPPADAARPTIVVSYGGGGSSAQMSWLTEPLAAAGFQVAAVDHHGNNAVDAYLPEGFVFWWERARDLSFVLDRLAELEGLGPVGAAGFSLGGYTAAALFGARIDRDRFGALLSGEFPLPPPPEYPDLERDLRARLSDEELARLVVAAGDDYADERVRAAFLVCPALGPMIDERSLAAIARPAALHWLEADEITPPDENARRFATFIPGADGRAIAGAAGHYTFLADNPNGVEIRRAVAADAVEFFKAQLG